MSRFAYVLLMLVLVASGCGGGGGDPEASSSPDQIAASATPTPSASGSPGKTTSGGSTGEAGPQPTKGAPLEPDAVKPATPGTYVADNSGTETMDCGTPQTTDQPKTTKIVVDPANGARQRSTADARHSNGDGEVTTTILEYRPSGVFLIYFKISQTVPLLGTSVVEFEPKAPPLVAPASPKKGQKWSFQMTSKDGDVTADSSNEVLGLSETVKLGDGSPHTTTRAKSVTRVRGTTKFGAVDVTTTSTSWGSSSLGLVLKESSKSEGTVSTCKVSGSLESLLRTAKPG